MIDHAQAWLALKRVLGEKKSHGADALLAEMSRLEVAHDVPEVTIVRALRLYGVITLDQLLAGAITPPLERPAGLTPEGELGDGRDDRSALVAGTHRPEEDTDGRRTAGRNGH